MKRLLAAALLLAPSLASAQTVPPPFTTSGAVPTITQWSNAWAGKLDAADGVATGVMHFPVGSDELRITTTGGNISYYNNALGNSYALQGNYGAFSGENGAHLGFGGQGWISWQNANRQDSGAADVGLLRSATGTLAQHGLPFLGTGTTAQAYRVYNTFTDASNGEWGAFDWQTTPNVLTIGTQKNGTGTARNWQIVSGGSDILDYGVYQGGNLTLNPLNNSIVFGSAAGQMYPPNVKFSNQWSFGFTNSTTAFATMDIGISRAGVGVLAVGNGGVGDATGVIVAAAHSAAGTQPTITGAGGTCATSTKVGGASAGTVVLSGICATGNTIAWTGMPAQTNGYACDAEDRTTRTALFVQSASTTTGFTLTTGAVSSVAADVLQWKCIGF